MTRFQPLVVALAVALFVLGLASLPRPPPAPRALRGAPPVVPLASGCNDIYLDLGTNLGVQIRKVYEPQRFPNASINPFFDRYFLNRTAVCSFGFEPNPVHNPTLDRLEAFYARKGVKVQVLRVAVSTRDSPPGQGVPFYRNPGDANREWGARLSPPPTEENGVPAGELAVTVPELDFPSWFKREIVSAEPQTIVMKMDIEGSDPRVLGALVATGLLCRIDFLYLEGKHLVEGRTSVVDSTGYLRFLNEEIYKEGEKYGCRPIVVDLDDESYGDGSVPLDDGTT